MYIKFNQVEIGKRIKAARLEANMSQRELHELTDLSITQISAYESGKRNIGLQSLCLIAMATNKTMDELYYGKAMNKNIAFSKDKGELIVKCVDFLFSENIIANYEIEHGISEREFCNIGIIIYKYKDIIDDLVINLYDIKNYSDKYSNPIVLKSSF